MSLQFVIGPSGSGKTRYLYDTIIRESMAHPERQYLFLVPEQYTMQTQKELIRLHPRHGLTNVDVLSFNRLALRVFEDLAVETLTVLDDMGKSMVLRRIAGEKRAELKYYQRHFGQMGFVNQLKSMISELYQYGVTPEVLDELQESAEDPVLKDKLQDLGLIYHGFQEYIREKFTTAEEVLDLCCRLLPQWEKLSRSQVFLDGYTGFTPVQYRILEICLGRCSRVMAAVTADPEGPLYAEAGMEELFYMSRHMICRLIDAASWAGAVHEDDVLLKAYPPVRFRESPGLARLERQLSRGSGGDRMRGVDEEPGANGAHEILIHQGKNPAAEIRFLCRHIQEALRQGVRFRDMAVITGDLENYGREIRRQFEEQGIPFFLDDKKSILSSPLVELIRSALEVIRLNFPYESMFRYLKTSFLALDGEVLALDGDILVLNGDSEIGGSETGIRANSETNARAGSEAAQAELFRMENYVKALGIRGYRGWSQEWSRQYPGGESLNLERLNAMREAVTAPLFALREQLKEKPSTGASMTKALLAFLEECSLEERLLARSDKLMEEGMSEAAKEYSQVYSLTVELLERLCQLLGDETMGLAEYSQILDAGFGEIRVGLIPATVDRVVVGDITRTRLDGIRILYFAGVNEGIVPQRKENRSLLTDEERAFFAEKQIELAPSARESGLMQQFYLYLMMTKPSRQLVVTYAAQSGSGKELRPSSLIGELEALFPGERLRVGEEEYPIPHSGSEALLCLAEGLRNIWEQGENLGKPGKPRMLGEPEAPEEPGEEKMSKGSGMPGSSEPSDDSRFMDLFTYLLSQPPYKEQVKKLVEAASLCGQNGEIGRAAAKALYGNILQGSVTRLEQYAACAYAHFLKYGLELMRRQEYEVGAVDMGNLFHESLDLCFSSMKEQGLELTALSDEERRQLAQTCVTRAAEEYGNTILQSSSRNAYLIRRLSRITDRTMWALAEQLKKGDFKPAAFEVSFSAADNLKAMRIPLSRDEFLYLKGRIDRLDLCEEEKQVYVKIIDYKSGSLQFDLTAMYYGLQLQLVVYMDAALEMEERQHPGKEVVPAGLFYYHIQDPLVEKKGEMTPEEIEAQMKKQLRMSGLANSDLEVIRRMDREIQGESDVIPVAMKAGIIQEARSSVASGRRFGFLRDYVRGRCKHAGQEILEGNIAMTPYKDGSRTGCDYCPYHPVCGFDRKLPGHGYRRLKSLKPEEIWKEILPEEEEEDAVDPGTGKGNPEP